MSQPAPEKSTSNRTRVMLLAFGARAEIAEEAKRVEVQIARYADVVLTDLEFKADLTQVEADLAIVVGGDGSILRAALQMGYHQRPVLGVNVGKLGFLADLLPEQLEDVLPRICRKDFEVVEHIMFECRVLRDGQEQCCVLGLNEAAVLAGPPFAILEVQLYVDSQLATTYSCDGLIISTPVGSTAHSLSAGGPILRKNLPAFVISPISPHTLTNRPVVDSADRVYELVTPKPHEGTTLVVDGQCVCKLTADDRVRIERSRESFKLIRVPGHDYYRTLREKLGWGGRLDLKQKDK